jgi:adhesin transport system membrane fusion protein
MMKESQSEHLSKSVLLEESGNPVITKLVTWFAALSLAGFCFWAAVTPINEVATAKGEIVPTGQLKKVQHLEGGVITELLVAEGDIVDKGQILMKLDPLASTSQLNETEASLRALENRRKRLEAVIDGAEPDFSKDEDSGREHVSYQSKLFVQSLINKRTNRRVLESQIAQQQAALDELATRNKALDRQVRLFKEELRLRRQLFKKGLSSKTIVLALERQASERQGELMEIPQKVIGVEKKIDEIRAQMEKVDGEIVEEALKELTSIEEEKVRLQEVKTRQQQVLQQTEIRAPVAGLAHGLKAHTVGGVIAPGAVVLEVVPEDETLLAEIEIQTKDVGHMVPGLEAHIKFDAYEFSRYGGVEGKLLEISPTTFQNDAGIPYYRGIVVLDRAYIGEDTDNLRVRAGMTLVADIRTGEKTVADYVLKPIYLSAKSALTER